MVEWKTIGSLIERKRIKAKTLQEAPPVYAVTNTEGFVLSSSLHDFTIHSEDTSNYMVVGKNDFAYNPSRLNIGSISYFSEEGYGLISPMYVVFHADESIVTPEYLYTVIKSEGVRNKIDALKEVGARFRFDFSRWDLIQIPIPSFSEQNRIVGILDTFTDSIENLKQQIAQRRKQFEFYRDQLLDLEGKETKLIGDLFEFKNGLNKEKKYFGQGNPIVNYTDVYHNNKLTKSILKGRVTLEDKEIERYRVFRGDVFFTRTSETPEEIGYAAVLIDDIEDCTFSGFLLRARPITNLLLPEYCGYCFSAYKVRKEIIKLSTYTTRALTNGKSLSKIRIPVPPLSEQSRIVSILDTFEASISNLEAQLEQRQKQYDYYRNQLLTFEGG